MRFRPLTPFARRPLGLAALALAACSSPSAPTATRPPPPPEAAPPAPAPDRPKAQIGAWGFDRAGMDRSVSPGQSFYQYASGAWQRATTIPADKSNYGMFSALADLSDERTRAIIEEAAGQRDASGEARQVGDFYQSFMNEAAVEAAGLAPLRAELDAINAIKNVEGLVARFAADARALAGGPFVAAVYQDARRPEAHVAHLAQGGLGLPDRDMYDAKNAQFASQREGYKKYAAAMLGLAGVKNAEARALAVYALEEKMAAAHWTRLQNRDPQKTYNKMKVAELQKLAPEVPWQPWLAGVGLGQQPEINVLQPTAVAAVAKLVRGQPLAVWKDYLTLRLLTESAPVLAKAFADAHFEFYGKTLTGTPQQRERWKRGVDHTTQALGEAVAKLYVAKHFTPDTKARADELVRNLLAAMGKRLDGLTWMGAETKAKAKEKLSTYNPKIGYPKKWRDYSALKIVAGDPVGNDRRAGRFEYDRQLAKLGQPVDRDEWSMTPMTVNAYYSALRNEIVFPAAILQPPFFDPNADDAVNYGGIGAVIGHEVSHGFDDKGSQYDATGTLKNWWTEDDRAKFKAAADRLVAQYDRYCPFAASDGKPAQCVKGALTLGENIADLAGLTIAYDAYKLSLGGREAPALDGLTGDQRFFLGWAQVWRRLYREKELSNRLVTDVHSPSEYRVAVVRNLDAWYAAFNVKPGEALFLSPDERVKIW
ncbi:MAG TPA: M13 family metallopeptidase [Polyangiaceae bacterium]|nr:M13 family metallopeptidase [Polyangiaceae bacterium]